MPSIKFFLKHSTLKTNFLPNYDINADPMGTDRKGIVIEVSMVRDPTTKSYKLQATLCGAKGHEDPAGELPKIPNTLQILCPHPPPCQKDANGNFLKDADGNLIWDTTDPAFFDGCL